MVTEKLETILSVHSACLLAEFH